VDVCSSIFAVLQCIVDNSIAINITIIDDIITIIDDIITIIDDITIITIITTAATTPRPRTWR
jgi:hypothetical protein